MRILFTLIAAAAVTTSCFRAEARQKFEPFDSDPGWECFRCKTMPNPPLTIVQNFGYSANTNHAGGQIGEIGGKVMRSLVPAYYGMKIKPKTLNDHLIASGRMSLVKSSGGSGVFIGWFNSKRQGFRPVNALTWRIDAEGSFGRAYCDYSTGDWQTGGTPPPPGLTFPTDGKPRRWSLEYDPDGNGGNGTIRFEFEGHPALILNLEPGHKKAGAVFDRFGFFNVNIPGDYLKFYLDDLRIDGKFYDFAKDPKWEGKNNRCKMVDPNPHDAQNFGYSETSFAGGKKGELGGIFWRTEADTENHGYYADRIGNVSPKEKLVAKGKVAFVDTSVDSGIYFGWFNAAAFKRPAAKVEEIKPEQFIGIMIEGPSKVGHYFRPVVSDINGRVLIPPAGPVLRPDAKVRLWSLEYDPEAHIISASLDGRKCTLELPPDLIITDKSLDRFGVFTMRRGGHFVRFYFDDIEYTVSH